MHSEESRRRIRELDIFLADPRHRPPTTVQDQGAVISITVWTRDPDTGRLRLERIEPIRPPVAIPVGTDVKDYIQWDEQQQCWVPKPKEVAVITTAPS